MAVGHTHGMVLPYLLNRKYLSGPLLICSLSAHSYAWTPFNRCLNWPSLICLLIVSNLVFFFKYPMERKVFRTCLRILIVVRKWAKPRTKINCAVYNILLLENWTFIINSPNRKDMFNQVRRTFKYHVDTTIPEKLLKNKSHTPN